MGSIFLQLYTVISQLPFLHSLRHINISNYSFVIRPRSQNPAAISLSNVCLTSLSLAVNSARLFCPATFVLPQIVERLCYRSH